MRVMKMQKQRKISFELLRPFLYWVADVRNLLVAARAHFRNNRARLHAAVMFHDDESFRSILMSLKQWFFNIGEPGGWRALQTALRGTGRAGRDYIELFLFLDATTEKLRLESAMSQ
jgi:hypothetical protein